MPVAKHPQLILTFTFLTIFVSCSFFCSCAAITSDQPVFGAPSCGESRNSEEFSCASAEHQLAETAEKLQHEMTRIRS
jgi:hypothetical protein